MYKQFGEKIFSQREMQIEIFNKLKKNIFIDLLNDCLRILNLSKDVFCGESIIFMVKFENNIRFNNTYIKIKAIFNRYQYIEYLNYDDLKSDVLNFKKHGYYFIYEIDGKKVEELIDVK